MSGDGGSRVGEVSSEARGSAVPASEPFAAASVVRLGIEQAAAYRALLLEAYAAHPEAFTSTVAEREELPLAWWERRLADPAAPDDGVFGAFVGGRLVGVVGLSFERREKCRHQGRLFGIYLQREARGRGLGHRLVETALAAARARPGTRVVRLTVSERNGSAQRLYADCGFLPFGVEPLAIRVGDRFLAKVHMACDLQATPARHDSEVAP